MYAQPILGAVDLAPNYAYSALPLILHIAIGGALLAWIWWRYYAAGMVVSSIGIAERTPFGARTLRRADVTSVKATVADIATAITLRSR